MTEVSSSVYATPLITDLYSDGHKDIIVPSFVHYLEVRSPAAAAAAAQNDPAMADEQRAARSDSPSSVNMGAADHTSIEASASLAMLQMPEPPQTSVLA
jgi:hypothetical protein